MKKLIAVMALMAAPAQAQYYDYGQPQIEMQSQYIDITPNDGFMDRGTFSNPYVLRDNTGRTVGKVQPRFHDITLNDGFMDAGTFGNPYEIKRY